MKHYKIEIDVLEVVHDFYPGLSVEDASKIADSIVDAWDYTHDFDSINDDISWYADAHGVWDDETKKPIPHKKTIWVIV